MDERVENLVKAVKQHALEHYGREGWDYIVECWSDGEIAEAVKHCRKVNTALRVMRKEAIFFDTMRKDGCI